MDFNEIKNTWKSSFVEEEIGEAEIEKMLKIKQKTNTALGKVLRNYNIDIYGGFVIFLVFTVLLFRGEKVFDSCILGLVFISVMGAAFIFALKIRNRIRNANKCENNMKPTLIEIISELEKLVSFGTSKLYKFILMPFILLLGIIVGIHIASESKSVFDILMTFKTKTILIVVFVFIIASAIFIPFSQHLNKRMYKRHLDELKQCLKELIEDEENS